MITLFLEFHDEDPARRIAPEDLAKVEAIAQGIPQATAAIVMVPEQAQDRYNRDEPSPLLALQVYFPTIEAAEAAVGPGGALCAIVADNLPSLAGTRATHQLMLARTFMVPAENGVQGELSCSYMVHYPGKAEDRNAWLRYYLEHHPVIMARFPGIVGIEICTAIDWIDSAPWPRIGHFQRNKVVFPSREALEAALNSPVRDEMRSDFHDFPPFEGGSVHVPMSCHRVTLSPA